MSQRINDLTEYHNRVRSLQERYDRALLELLERSLDHIIDLYESAIHSEDVSTALNAIDQLENRALGYPKRTVEVIVSDSVKTDDLELALSYTLSHDPDDEAA